MGKLKKAEGVDLFEEPFGAEAVLQEREEAQGVELFTDPDAVVPAEALREGSPGHEAFAGDKLGRGRDAADEPYDRAPEESGEV